MADIILDQLGLKAGDIFKQSDVEKIDSNFVFIIITTQTLKMLHDY